MIALLLWTTMGLLIIASIVHRNRSLLIAGIAWGLYGIFWLTQPAKYIIEHDDVFNAALTLLGAIFCFGIGYFSISAYKKKQNSDTLFTATRVAALGGLCYFIFAEIDPLNLWLREAVTGQTVWLLNALSIPAIQLNSIHIILRNQIVEIILACTAIESMALFAGLTLCVNAPLRKRISAFLVSVPVIYIANLFRNAFVVTAFGYEWFGSADQSFYIAHHVISKFLAITLLILIAYYVFKILPELLEFISNLIDMFVIPIQKRLRGERGGAARQR